jgi:hypothetical protein
MTKQEFIDSEMPFYHITPTRNKENILASGLLKKNPRGICVVRSINEDVVKYIVDTMLIDEDDYEFSIIEIFPNKHILSALEIANDYVDEITNPIHNYILRESLVVEEEDFINTYARPRFGILDITPIINAIRENIVLEHLT